MIILTHEITQRYLRPCRGDAASRLVRRQCHLSLSYLGPSFAVLLFQHVGVLGVAWFRIASAALVFAVWTKPWQTFRSANRTTVVLLLLLGACLALMNSAFYLAIDWLPLSLVATMEFVGTIAVALFGLRALRNYAALALAIAGVFILTDVSWSNDLLGLGFAVVNALLFMTYIILGHRISEQGAGEGVNRLGAAMAAAFVFVMPIGLPAPASTTACDGNDNRRCCP